MIGVGVVIGLLISASGSPASNAAAPGIGFAAIPGQKGGQDLFGAYDVVSDWPKPLSQLPGHEDWTWGTVTGVSAQSADRVFVLQRGELPGVTRPPFTRLPELGPSFIFPVDHAPLRNASLSSMGDPSWSGKPGVDARWEHCILVLNAEGTIVEAWTQWDSLFTRPHSIYVNPYDAEKHVWVVDDFGHAVYKFSNDGKRLVQTLGTPKVPGEDPTHFARPAALWWLPDSTLYVADGYINSRVVKFDADGKYLMAWGQKGSPPNDTRPGYFNEVHGIAGDPDTRRIFVNDRLNRRIQVFDENGTFLDQWSVGRAPSSEALVIHLSNDRHLWVVDRTSSKIIKYDLEGRLLYSWGASGEWPGGMWGVHGLSVDEQGNVYVAEVDNGRVQKYRPRPGANPAFLIDGPAFPAT
jgi:hypothetical protein